MSIRIRIKEPSGIWVNHESRMNGPADSIFQSQSKFSLIILEQDVRIFMISNIDKIYFITVNFYLSEETFESIG